MSFVRKYKKAVKKNKSLICVGLDSDLSRLPECLKKEKNPIMKFNHEIIQATSDLVCAYKPNAAFYESAGMAGFEAWEDLKVLSSDGEGIPFIADVKRGDIGNTATHYARAIFENGGFDAATINPYMGWDTIEPFLRFDGKYLFLLDLTSNPSAVDFEYEDGMYKKIARKTREWNHEAEDRLGLVVGATRPGEMKEIRDMAGDVIILVPGIGTQGGDAGAVIRNGYGGETGNLVINVSRGIIFSGDGDDFAEQARRSAIHYRGIVDSAIKGEI